MGNLTSMLVEPPGACTWEFHEHRHKKQEFGLKTSATSHLPISQNCSIVTLLWYISKVGRGVGGGDVKEKVKNSPCIYTKISPKISVYRNSPF